MALGVAGLLMRLMALLWLLRSLPPLSWLVALPMAIQTRINRLRYAILLQPVDVSHRHDADAAYVAATEAQLQRADRNVALDHFLAEHSMWRSASRLALPRGLSTTVITGTDGPDRTNAIAPEPSQRRQRTDRMRQSLYQTQPETLRGRRVPDAKLVPQGTQLAGCVVAPAPTTSSPSQPTTRPLARQNTSQRV